MEIKSIFSVILKRLWIIAALVVITVSLTGYVNFFVFEPVYEAYTTLLITGLENPISNDAHSMSFEDIIAGQSLVNEYSEIIKSRRVISKVLEELNIDELDEDDLRDRIHIASLNDTRILAISVQNEDPALAVKIADSFAKTFSSEISDMYKIENINIIDSAKQPEAPIAPTKKRNLALAFVSSLVFGISIAFFIEYLDSSIRTAEDVEKHLSLNVIGTIPVHSLE